MAIKSIQWTGRNRGELETFLDSLDYIYFYINDTVYVSLSEEEREVVVKVNDWICMDRYCNLFKLTDSEYNENYR
jgi:hypothetical protein